MVTASPRLGCKGTFQSHGGASNFGRKDRNDRWSKTFLVFVADEKLTTLIIEAPLFLNRNVGFTTMKELCFKIFHTYGLAPFQRKYKNRKWSDPITLYYISKRIESENLRLQTREDWHKLLGDFLLLRADTERQWKWSNLSSAGLWDCIENYGCANSNCKEMKALIMVRDFNKKGSREPPVAVEERLRGWGEKLKGCTGCRLVVYCCRECQQTAWPTHKTQCKEEKKRREMWTKYRDETKVTDA